MSKPSNLSPADAAQELALSLEYARSVEQSLCNLYAGLEAAAQQLIADSEGRISLPEGDRMGFLFGFLATSNHMMYLQRDLSEIIDRAENAMCSRDEADNKGGQHEKR